MPTCSTASPPDGSVSTPRLFVRRLTLGVLCCLLVGCGKDPVGELPQVPAGDEEPALILTLQNLHNAAQREPSDANARGRLAMAYDVNAFPERAIVVYGQAAQLDDGAFDWPYFRALLLAHTHTDYEGALESLDAALAIDDSYVPAWLSRGTWLRALNQPEDARAAFDEAAKLGAGAPAMVGIAQLYIDASQFEQAVALLEPLNAEAPDPRIDSLLARAYRALGQEALARVAAARGSAATTSMQWIDPKLGQHARFIAGFSNRLLHAQNMIKVGRRDDALDLARELVKEQPESISAINTLAWANVALGRIDAAQAVLEKGIDLHPNEPRIHQMMANAYRDEGDMDGSRRHLERVLEIDAENADALEDLGWLLAKAGETAKGIEMLERALTNGAPEPKRVLYRLGLLDGAEERWPAAAARFRDAAKIDAGFTMAYVHLARCLAEMGLVEDAKVTLEWADFIGSHPEERGAARLRIERIEAAVAQAPSEDAPSAPGADSATEGNP